MDPRVGGERAPRVCVAFNRLHLCFSRQSCRRVGAHSLRPLAAWQSAARFIILIADAPCHGRRFHSLGDSYPNGDPNGLQVEDLITRLHKQGIKFVFTRINAYTDQMIQEFDKEFVKVGAEKTKVIDLSRSDAVSSFGDAISNELLTRLQEQFL